MEPFFGFLAASVIGLGIGALTYLTARKSGLTAAQTALVDTIGKNAKALEDRVSLLEEQINLKESELIELRRQVADLRATIVNLAGENAKLRQQLGLSSGG